MWQDILGVVALLVGDRAMPVGTGVAGGLALGELYRRVAVPVVRKLFGSSSSKPRKPRTPPQSAPSSSG